MLPTLFDTLCRIVLTTYAGLNPFWPKQQAKYRFDKSGNNLNKPSLLLLDNFTILSFYHQGFFHSVRRNPSLNCFHRRRYLAILGQAGPRWRIRLYLHLVLCLPCRFVHSHGVHSVTRLVHLLSLTTLVYRYFNSDLFHRRRRSFSPQTPS